MSLKQASVGEFLTALEKDVGEWTGQAANQGQQNVRRRIRASGDRDYAASKAR